MRMQAFRLLQARASELDVWAFAAYKAINREGMIHERVRLFRGAVFPWWSKNRSRLAQRVIEESAAHEETARTARLDAETIVERERRALLDDYHAALSTLAVIAANTPDPMEMAARALDAAEARMARFAVEEPVDAPLDAVNARMASEMRDAST